MQKVRKTRIPPAAYFEMEEQAETKSEYYNGEIFAMTGASHRHNVISVNITAALHNRLQDRDCFIYGGDMKIEVAADAHYTYPDVSVVCGKPEFAGRRDDTFKNPLVIFEVLSASTRDYDRGSKFKAYRKIPSLQDYFLVDQYTVSVEHFYKDDSGGWHLEEFESRDAALLIRSLSVEIGLGEIYHRLEMGSDQTTP